MSEAVSGAAYVQRYVKTDGLVPAESAFGVCLRAMRLESEISQSRLADRAGFDHSYVSRLESGNREPTRNAVLALSEAMGLEPSDRDVLLASAGFMPVDLGGFVRTVLAEEPVVAKLYTLLTDPRTDPDHVWTVRQMVAAVVNGRPS